MCTASAFVEFAGPHDYIKHLYSDGSGELMKACEICSWIHETSAPERKNRNAVAERSVRSVKEGARTTLLRCGLGDRFGPMAIRHWCFAKNTCRKVFDDSGAQPPRVDGTPTRDTAYARRHKGHAKVNIYLSELWWTSSQWSPRGRSNRTSLPKQPLGFS